MNKRLFLSIFFVASLYAGRKTKIESECFKNISVALALQPLISSPILVKSYMSNNTEYTKSDNENDMDDFNAYQEAQEEELIKYFNNSNDQLSDNSDNENYDSDLDEHSTTDKFIWGIDEESDNETIDNNRQKIVSFEKEYNRKKLRHIKKTRGKMFRG